MKKQLIIFIIAGILLLICVGLILINISTYKLYITEKNKDPVVVTKEVVVNVPINVFLTEMQINKVVDWYRNNDLSEYENILAFYDGFTHDRKVTIAIVERCLSKEIPIHQGLALAWWESNFDPNKKTYAPNGTIDRGLFQLNNGHRKSWKITDFYDIDKNSEEGLSYLAYCNSLDEDFDELGCVAYNGGTSVLKTHKVQFTTLIHLIEVKRKEKKLDVSFNIDLLKTLKHIIFNENNSIQLDINK